MSEPAIFLTARALSARHGFFTRRGGVSKGIFASLQTGFGAEGDARENVAENRRRVLAALKLEGATLLAPFQTHSAEAMIVDAPYDERDPPKVDGLVTRNPAIAVGALAADCAPVLFEDREAGVVGACHAGWRGALDGIVEATLAKMLEAGAARDRIRVAIGPRIGPAAYEVGPEFEARFVAADAANARFFGPPAEGAPEDRRRFDLARYIAEARLDGLPAERLERCTYSEPDDFFSHRRSVHDGAPTYGRLISVIAPVWR